MSKQDRLPRVTEDTLKTQDNLLLGLENEKEPMVELKRQDSVMTPKSSMPISFKSQLHSEPLRFQQQGQHRHSNEIEYSHNTPLLSPTKQLITGTVQARQSQILLKQGKQEEMQAKNDGLKSPYPEIKEKIVQDGKDNILEKEAELDIFSQLQLTKQILNRPLLSDRDKLHHPQTVECSNFSFVPKNTFSPKIEQNLMENLMGDEVENDIKEQISEVIQNLKECRAQNCEENELTTLKKEISVENMFPDLDTSMIVNKSPLLAHKESQVENPFPTNADQNILQSMPLSSGYEPMEIQKDGDENKYEEQYQINVIPEPMDIERQIKKQIQSYEPSGSNNIQQNQIASQQFSQKGYKENVHTLISMKIKQISTSNDSKLSLFNALVEEQLSSDKNECLQLQQHIKTQHIETIQLAPQFQELILELKSQFILQETETIEPLKKQNVKSEFEKWQQSNQNNESNKSVEVAYSQIPFLQVSISPPSSQKIQNGIKQQVVNINSQLENIQQAAEQQPGQSQTPLQEYISLSEVHEEDNQFIEKQSEKIHYPSEESIEQVSPKFSIENKSINLEQNDQINIEQPSLNKIMDKAVQQQFVFVQLDNNEQQLQLLASQKSQTQEQLISLGPKENIQIKDNEIKAYSNTIIENNDHNHYQRKLNVDQHKQSQNMKSQLINKPSFAPRITININRNNEISMNIFRDPQQQSKREDVQVQQQKVIKQQISQLDFPRNNSSKKRKIRKSPQDCEVGLKNKDLIDLQKPTKANNSIWSPEKMQSKDALKKQNNQNQKIYREICQHADRYLLKSNLEDDDHSKFQQILSGHILIRLQPWPLDQVGHKIFKNGSVRVAMIKLITRLSNTPFLARFLFEYFHANFRIEQNQYIFVKEVQKAKLQYDKYLQNKNENQKRVADESSDDKPVIRRDLILNIEENKKCQRSDRQQQMTPKRYQLQSGMINVSENIKIVRNEFPVSMKDEMMQFPSAEKQKPSQIKIQQNHNDQQLERSQKPFERSKTKRNQKKVQEVQQDQVSPKFNLPKEQKDNLSSIKTSQDIEEKKDQEPSQLKYVQNLSKSPSKFNELYEKYRKIREQKKLQGSNSSQNDNSGFQTRSILREEGVSPLKQGKKRAQILQEHGSKQPSTEEDLIDQNKRGKKRKNKNRDDSSLEEMPMQQFPKKIKKSTRRK